MGNGYSQNYGYYGPYYGGHTPHAQFYGPDPQQVHCPKCKQTTTSELKFVFGVCTWFYLILHLVFVGGLILLWPFLFCNCCSDAKHYCSVCDTYIGRYERFSGRPVVILPPECHKHQVEQQKNIK
uniref:LITAF domain-containing protein n=1 Tax=Meloidogyne incognita TaxID=6306 RepID=A0A914LI51_MELIC